MARRGGVHHYGTFTPARRAQLKKAAYISAAKRHARRKQRIRTGILAVGAIGAVGAGAYLGHRHGGTAVTAVRNFKPGMANFRNQIAMRVAVNPGVKEAMRATGSISHDIHSPNTGGQFSSASLAKARAEAAAQSAAMFHHTPGQTSIFEGDKAKAEATMAALAKAKLPPHLGGPDKRKYNEDSTVDSERMTRNSVRKTLAANRRKVAGTKTTSNTSALGGPAKKPAKAIKQKGHSPSGLTEDQIQAALGFDEAPRSYPKAQKGSTKATVAAVTAKKAGGTAEGTKVHSDVTPIFSHAKNIQRQENMIPSYDAKSDHGRRVRKVAQSVGLDIGSKGHLHRPLPGYKGAEEASPEDRMDFWNALNKEFKKG